MNLYIVTVEGVYRHEIIGVYDDKEKAAERAIAGLDNEHDDYHTMAVSTLELNIGCEDSKTILEFTQEGKKTKYENGKHVLIEKGIITRRELFS